MRTKTTKKQFLFTNRGNNKKSHFLQLGMRIKKKFKTIDQETRMMTTQMKITCLHSKSITKRTKSVQKRSNLRKSTNTSRIRSSKLRIKSRHNQQSKENPRLIISAKPARKMFLQMTLMNKMMDITMTVKAKTSQTNKITRADSLSHIQNMKNFPT